MKTAREVLPMQGKKRIASRRRGSSRSSRLTLQISRFQVGLSGELGRWRAQTSQFGQWKRWKQRQPAVWGVWTAVKSRDSPLIWDWLDMSSTQSLLGQLPKRLPSRSHEMPRHEAHTDGSPSLRSRIDKERHSTRVRSRRLGRSSHTCSMINIIRSS
jgi:hypothetical protein